MVNSSMPGGTTCGFLATSLGFSSTLVCSGTADFGTAIDCFRELPGAIDFLREPAVSGTIDGFRDIFVDSLSCALILLAVSFRLTGVGVFLGVGGLDVF